jgi:hypothetical protein
MIGEKEYALVEQKFSPRFARVALLAVVSGIVATGLIAVGTLVGLTFSKVVFPVVQWFGTTRLASIPGPSVVTVGISIAATLLLLVLAGYLTVRWIRNWQKLVLMTLGGFVGKQDMRFRHLEANSAEFRSTSNEILALKRRVTNLEPDVVPPSKPGEPPSTVSLRTALIRRLSEGNDSGINAVGQTDKSLDGG